MQCVTTAFPGHIYFTFLQFETLDIYSLQGADQ